jgi:nicotinamidase-related amidase
MNPDGTGRAIVSIDYINEIIDPKGKLAGKGYAAFDQQHGALEKAKAALQHARQKGLPVFHVRVGFSPDYKEQPEGSPLFGAAKKFGALQLGTWATEFHPKVAPDGAEAIITKHRVSAFYSTPLEMLLRKHAVREVLIWGVATDLAVQAAARDAHDRDFSVVVLADCCTAANDEDHSLSLKTLGKIAKVSNAQDILKA